MWFVEGDIKACFDSFDHHIMVDILRARISDEYFLALIWKFLRAGYMEQWQYHKTYSGTPQGSGVREEMEQRSVLINTNRSALSDEEIQQHLNLIRETTIEEVDFTMRTFNCLAKSGLSTLGDIIDLINSGPNQFANIRNLGLSGQGEVLRKLKGYGVDFTDRILYAESNE